MPVLNHTKTVRTQGIFTRTGKDGVSYELYESTNFPGVYYIVNGTVTPNTFFFGEGNTAQIATDWGNRATLTYLSIQDLPA